VRPDLAGSASIGKRLAFVCFTLVVLVVAAAVFAEVAYRIFAPRPEVFDLSGLHEFRPDREWLYRGRPGVEGEILGTHYTINADGFRGPVHARPGPPDKFRVVVLGDSIAFGFGVREEQTFPRVLETLLAERAPEALVEVINLGTGGYSAWNEARLLEDVGISYAPDLVLVQFSINDLNDPTSHFGTQTKLVLGSIPDAAFPDPARSRGIAPLRRWVSRACHLFQLCTALRQRTADQSKPMRHTQESVRAFRDPVESTDRVEWRWLEDRYDEMAAAAESAGARFAVLAFPYRSQMKGKNPHPVSQHLESLARQRGWLLVDPLAAFRETRHRGVKLFMDIWHPTPAGHRVAATETLRVLACGDALGAEARSAVTGPPCPTP
jgi:lysophospholipase L1-like esterase